MKVVHSDYKIVTEFSEGGIKELKEIELAARVCYKSEDKITEDGSSANSIVSRLIKSGHDAMIEHGPTLKVIFTIDRGIANEIVRHRLFSFAQESTRYCSYDKGKFGGEITVIDIADGTELCPKSSKLDSDVKGSAYVEWLEAMKDAERHYMKLIELGVSPQIARGALPTSVKTELVVSGNYREWRNFFKLRTSVAAHPQMREITIPLLRELKERLPVIFDDIDVE